MQATKTIIGVEPEGIAADLKTYANWVVHRNKEPYDPKTGRRASTTDSRTWGTFDEALDAFESGRWDGLGFCFSSGDPFCGIDLDNCRDPRSGVVEGWAQELIDRFDSYVEVSPSGRGLHIVVEGKSRRNGKRTADGKTFEVYSRERYFRLTGVAP